MLSWADMGGESEHIGEGTQFLVVRSGGHRCAIPVGAAKLVSKAPEIVPLPGSAPRLLGLAQIAGEPVAVVDLHALLDPRGGPSGVHELTVIIRDPGGTATLGLAVDEAFGVTSVADPRPPSAGDPEWVDGWSDVDGRSVVVMDPQRLFIATEGAEKGAYDAS